MKEHQKVCKNITEQYPYGPEEEEELDYDSYGEPSYIIRIAGELPEPPQRRANHNDLKLTITNLIKENREDEAIESIKENFESWVDCFGLESTMVLCEKLQVPLSELADCVENSFSYLQT